MKKKIGVTILIIGLIFFCIGLWFIGIPAITLGIILMCWKDKEEKKTNE